VSSAAIPQTTARYIVEYSVTELPFSVTVRRTALVDRVTGEVLGTRGSVEGRGGWLRRVVGGPSDQCHGDWEAHLRFVYDTLRPVGHHAGPPIPPSLD